MNAKRILFATMPMDGHFSPLTGLAVYLKNQGYDVRWYTGGPYAEKAEKLGIPAYRFQKARVINQENLDTLFPERQRIKGSIARLKFDIKHVFVLPTIDYMIDLKAIRDEFAFDLLVCDCGFCASQLVQQLFDIPVVVMGIMPLMQSSRDLPPNGLGLTPANTWLGQQKQAFLRFVTSLILRESTATYNQVLLQHGLKPEKGGIFDIGIRVANLYLQSGTPGFEYTRSDLSPNVRFVGPLMPHKTGPKRSFAYPNKLKQYKKAILVTQGTIERNPEKLLVPTLEAFKGSDYLVIVTTGGSQTEALRARYPHDNIIIEDFIDFNCIMPHVDLYVTNGGYGGVLLSIENKLPMVTAGIHEGKNEIAARVGYFKLGINLKTETPTPHQIRQSVERVLTDVQYKRNVGRLSQEFSQYTPNVRCEQYISQLLMAKEARPTAELV